MSNFTFPEIEYKRPDVNAVKKQLKKYTKLIKRAKTIDDIKQSLAEFEKEFGEFGTMMSVCSIRHTLDTTDAFYEKENEYFNQQMPLLSVEMLNMMNALLKSKLLPEIEKEYGTELLEGLRRSKKSFCLRNIPLQQKEAKLTSEYEKLMASAKIPFDGKELNIYGLTKYLESTDREVRKAAMKQYTAFFESHEVEFERIFDELVTIRNKQGKNLGFKDYIPLGYLSQGRGDYGQEEVAAFRQQVLEDLVPFCNELYNAQAKRIGVDTLYHYDEELVYPEGNADPIGTEEELVEKARAMYHDMCPDTAEFIDYMIDHKLMDLTNRPGKASTGYCSALISEKAPFVFSCFNGTAGDVHVLTHELGHAFATYMAFRNTKSMLLANCSTDIAEIHSMAMEQFCYPYAESFFGKENADKFRFSHLQNALTFVPFGVAVDEFQHIIYANPKLTPKERTLEWRKLEQKYMPWRKYDENPFFERGGWWYHKIHIFLYPFYYVNYTLTTMGALELKSRWLEDKDAAWNDYSNLCKAGSSLSYLGLLRLANLSVPFAPGTVKKVTQWAKDALSAEIAKEQN